MDAQRKTQLEQRVVTGLFVVFAAVLFVGPLKSMGLFRRQAAQGPSTPEATPTAPPREQAQAPGLPGGQTGVPQQSPAASPATAPVVRYTAHDLRDPLKSLLYARQASASQGKIRQEAAQLVGAGIPPEPVPPLPQLTVQGLWWGSEQPQAIINGNVYGVHETVDGARILSIGRDGVVIEWAGQAIHLTTQRPR
ncbi:MAG: hypothetical protein Q8R91_01355 [Candidatus Omnitrophota bacterium]|nr:hypothetical protein [Candidatus Omnitrophota bacterium]